MTFGLFLQSLFASWMAWVGAILRLIPFFESFVEKPLRKNAAIDRFISTRGDKLKKDLKIIALICLFIGCYRAWVFEYRNTQAVIKDKAQAVGDLGLCRVDLRGSQSEAKLYEEQVHSQQGALFSNQSTLDSCVLSLGKMAIPERPRISTSGFLLRSITNKFNTADRAGLLVASTNHDFVSFKGTLTCQTPFDVYQIELSQGAFTVSMGTGPGPAFRRDLSLDFANSTWRPGDYVLVVFHGDNLEPQKCSILSK